MKAVNAGADIVLVAHGYENEEAVAAALKSAAESGKISSGRIDESAYRILKLKAAFNPGFNPIESVDKTKINNDLSAILKALNNNMPAK